MQRFDRKIELILADLDTSMASHITDLKVTFNIRKDNSSSLNEGRIEVYNLNKDTAAILNKSKVKVTLKAGYGDDIATLTVSDAIRSYTARQGEDVVTTIELLDGKTEGEKKLSIGYPPGTSTEDIMKDMCRIAGAEYDKTSNTTPVKQKNGFSYTGTLKDGMQKLATAEKSKTSIQNGKVKSIGIGKYDNKPVQYLSNTTGLLETPIKLEDVDPDKKTKYAGYKIKSLLLPGIAPGNRVVVDSIYMKEQILAVTSVEHNGDNFGEEWCTTLEALIVKDLRISKQDQVAFK